MRIFKPARGNRKLSLHIETGRVAEQRPARLALVSYAGQMNAMLLTGPVAVLPDIFTGWLATDVR